MRKIKLEYDKKHEEKSRKSFERSNTYGKYPSNPTILYAEEASDNLAWLNAENNKVEADILLSKLSARQREAFELKAAGYNKKEIAETMKISENAVKQLLKRVKATLSKSICA